MHASFQPSDTNRFLHSWCAHVQSFICLIAKSELEFGNQRTGNTFKLLAMASIALHLDAVRSFIDQIKGTKAFDDVIKAQKVHFEQLLSGSSLSMADAERVCVSLKSIQWPARVLEELLQLVAAKTLEGGTSITTRCKLQDFQMLMHYFTQEHWAMLTNDRLSSHHKLQLIIGHMHALGLRNATEATFQTMTGVFLVATDGFAKLGSLLPNVKYTTLQHVKKTFKKAATSSCQVWVSTLPRDPPAFKASFPQLYSDVFDMGPPTPCPFDAVQMEAMIATIPMRNSSKHLSPSSSEVVARSPAAPMDMHVMQGFMQMMQSMMANNGTFGRQGSGGLDIKMLGSGGSSSSEGLLAPIVPQQRSHQPFRLQLPGAIPKFDDEDEQAEDGQHDDSANKGNAVRVSFAAPPSPSPVEQAQATASPGQATANRMGELLSPPSSGKRKFSVDDTTQHILNQIMTRDAAKPKPKAKGKASAKTKAAGVKAEQYTEPKQPKAKAKAKCKATFGVERSRQQVMCRSADGKCKGLKFKDHGGEAGAVRAAEAWFKKGARL